MFDALKLVRSAKRFVPTAGTFTSAFVALKPDWSSALCWASSFCQKARPRLASAELLYSSTPVRTAVTPDAPLKESP